MKREVTITLIARQIAVSQGMIWDKLPPKRQIEVKTLAQNIVATVERSQVKYQWEHVT